MKNKIPGEEFLIKFQAQPKAKKRTNFAKYLASVKHCENGDAIRKLDEKRSYPEGYIFPNGTKLVKNGKNTVFDHGGYRIEHTEINLYTMFSKSNSDEIIGFCQNLDSAIGLAAERIDDAAQHDRIEYSQNTYSLNDKAEAEHHRVLKSSRNDYIKFWEKYLVKNKEPALRKQNIRRLATDCAAARLDQKLKPLGPGVFEYRGFLVWNTTRARGTGSKGWSHMDKYGLRQLITKSKKACIASIERVIERELK